MNLIVCVKQVPSTTDVRMDPVTHTIVRDARQSVLNPFDSFAVELAVQLKEQHGGTVTTLSMGIPATEALLRDTIARGADNAVLLTDRRFAGADTLATSYTLSLGVGAIGSYNCILCGKMAVDGDTAQIGPELAEQLKIPHATNVQSIDEALNDHLIVTQQIDGGTRQLHISLPCVLTVVRDIVMVRMPSIPGIQRSLAADVRMLDADDIDADPTKIGLSGSPTQVVDTYVPQRKKKTVQLYGNTVDLSNTLLDIIRENGGDACDTH